jgi:hypothetical protein
MRTSKVKNMLLSGFFTDKKKQNANSMRHFMAATIYRLVVGTTVGTKFQSLP